MAAVRVPDVLLRVSPKNLERFQSLAVAGAGRGRAAPLPYTFTRADASSCATYWDSAGILRLASANNLRVDDYGPYYEQGLVDSAGLPLHGIRLEGTRTNVVLWNRDLTNAAWVKTGGGGVSAVKDQTGIDGVASSASRITASGANGTCLQSITLGSSARAQSCFIKRLVGTGNIDMTMDNGSTWTTLTGLSSTAWTRVTIPTQTLANPIVGFRIVTSADSVAIDYVQNENGAFRSNPIATTTTAVVRATDGFTLPFNFGPLDCTVLYRIARPVWADAAGDIGLFPTPLLLSTTTPRIEVFFSSAARQFSARYGDSGSQATANIPAGAELKFISQHKNAATLPAVAVDVGSGLTAFDTGAAVFTAYANQTINLNVSGGQLYGVLIDLPICRDLFSHAEMVAIP